MKNFFLSGKAFLSQKQGSILSAAFIIMALTIASQLLGLIKLRVIAHFFSSDQRSIFFAAFFPSETLFSILGTGSMATAFIPVFTSLLGRGDRPRAWYVANITITTLLSIFAVLSVILVVFISPITSFLTPGFSLDQRQQVIVLARWLTLTQAFFLLVTFQRGVQESLGRFLVPAIAPLFYTSGIIAGSVILSSWGLWGPTVGAIVGSALQFVIQLPFTRPLGFHLLPPRLSIKDPDFLRIVLLSLPIMSVLVVGSILRGVELSLATLISVGAYGNLVFANTLQFVPLRLFGDAFAKAALPTFSLYASRYDKESFARTFHFVLGQVLFFVIPIAVMLAVLRIPVARIAFGAEQFTWEDTVQTGLALSAFSIGIFAQGMLTVLTRSFYALQDTRTPMATSIAATLVNIALAVIFITQLHLAVWGIALAFSLAVLVQAGLLMILLDQRMKIISRMLFAGISKIIFAAGISGAIMYFLLKVLDQAVWDKRLSFLGQLGLALPTPFQNFVLDTRYTIDLVFLTLLVMTVGFFVYLFVAALLRVREVEILSRLVAGILSRKIAFAFPPTREAEIPEPLPPGG